MTLACVLFPEQLIRIFASADTVVAAGTAYLRIVCLSYMFVGVTLALIAAMRSVEVARIGMLVALVSLFVNIGLNYVLIFGKLGLPAMGIRGAALATVISRFVEMCVMIFYVTKVDRKLNLQPADLLASDRIPPRFHPQRSADGRRQCRLERNMMTSSAILVAFRRHYGGHVANDECAGFVTMNGMTAAVSIITGKTVGAGRTELMKEYARTVQIIFLVVGLLTGGGIPAALSVRHLYGASALKPRYVRESSSPCCRSPWWHLLSGMPCGLVKAAAT